MENLLWGAPRIHGELLKLGFSVAQSTVATYMVKRRGPPSQGWRTFPRNHAPDIAAMDFFVVPTIGFRILYGFVIVRLHRRDLVWINVTTNPTAEWVARQVTEQPCNARDGQALSQIAPCKVELQFVQDLREAQVFVGQPPRQRAVAEPEPAGDLRRARLAKACFFVVGPSACHTMP
jgi:hypothetical protein